MFSRGQGELFDWHPNGPFSLHPKRTALAELLRGRGTQWDTAVVDAFAQTLPGGMPSPRARWAEVRPLLRSLGAAVGVVG